MKTILAKLKEQSTWTGIAGVIASLAFVPHSADIGSTIGAIGLAVVSVLKIWLPDTQAAPASV